MKTDAALYRAASAARNSKSLSGQLQDALGILLIRIDAGFHRVHDRLIDHQLSVVANINLESIHRARRRPFEVESGDVIARAVARTFELLLGLQPSRRASQMGAFGEDRVETRLGADDPGAEILLELLAHFANHVIIRQAGLEFRWRQKEHARKRRANRREQADQRECTESRPSEHTQKIAPTPQCAGFGLFLVPLRPFFRLLVLTPLLEFGRIGRSLLFECDRHLSDATSQLVTSLLLAQPRRIGCVRLAKILLPKDTQHSTTAITTGASQNCVNDD